jgi:ATP-dependent DNA helicase RecQ
VDLDQILKEKFKKQAFRDGQKQIIEKALAGDNVFATIPTGGGKSLCYQFLAGLNKGQVLVISPLVALIDDQHKEAQELGLKSVKIHSNIDSKDKKRFYEKVGQAEIIFLTPERLIQSDFWSKTEGQLDIKYLVIDEAHCMSQWGSDFRPDYTRIPDYLEPLKDPQVLALTATATQKVQKDVLDSLRLKSDKPWFIYAAPLERPNIEISIFECLSFSEKMDRIIYWLKKVEGPKIIYFSLVSHLELASEELMKKGFRHVKYHGQLPSHVKLKNQKSFFKDEESLILATPAFGLGVNKPDIRLVIHYEMPQSIEAYYQEVGRAGRDGLFSQAELLYNSDDGEIHIDFLKWNHPEPGFITSIYNLISDYPQRYRQEGANFLREKLNFYNKRDFRVETAINLLKRWDVLWEDADLGPQLASREKLLDVPDIDEELYSIRKRSAQMRLLQLIQLIEKFKEDSTDIQKDILEYFAK